MDENEDFRERQKRVPPRRSQGVRIIGAEEAAAAIEAGQASGRRPLDEPRYGDVPRTPEGPRPVHRFPLPESVNTRGAAGAPEDAGRESNDDTGALSPVAGGYDEEGPYEDRPSAWDADDYQGGAEEHDQGADLYDRSRAAYDRSGTGLFDESDEWQDARPQDQGDSPADWYEDRQVDAAAFDEAPGMQHWTEPPTGEVPQVLATGRDEDLDDEMAAWASLPSRKASWRDEFDDWDQPGYEPAMLADDETRVGALDETRADRPDIYSFDFSEGDELGTGDFFDERAAAEPVRPAKRPRRRTRRGAPAPPAARPVSGPSRLRKLRGGLGEGPGKLGAALPTGIAFGVLAIILFKLGPVTSLLLAATLVTLAAAEVYAVLRKAGYRPATLLGLVATICAMVGAYLRGEAAIPLVVAMTVVFGLLWYLLGVVKARPTINFAMTVGAFVWVGVLGSFAGLLLDPRAYPQRHGVAFLLGAVVATVAYDIGGYAVGRFGRHRMAPGISPNKTWEGLVGGMAASLLVSAVVVSHLHPWTLGRAAALGLVVAVVAPLGDLCESLIKRDLGIKDMGSLLPGHGGVVDRIDALLFVVPATYYLVRVLNIG